VENYPEVGPLELWLWGGFHFGAVYEMGSEMGQNSVRRGRDVPRGTLGLWRIGRVIDSSMFHVEQIGGVSGDLGDLQENRPIFDPKRAIIGDFCSNPFSTIFRHFSVIFRKSIFDDQFAAIRFMLSYLDSTSWSFCLRSTVSQFL